VQRYVLFGCAAVCWFALSVHASAQSFNRPYTTTCSVNPEIIAVLREFPAGGLALRQTIARMVEADASLVNDVVCAANTANTFQWEAIRLGLWDAANFFAAVGSNTALDAARQIQTILGQLSPDTGAAPSLSPDAMQGIPGFNNVSTSGCISPSRPGCS